MEIYEILNKSNVKFVWSNIVPRNDNPELNAKAALINAMVGVRVMKKDGVYIVRNDNFYSGDIINPALFNEDGIHIFEAGIGKLANNVRSTICRSLNKEFVPSNKMRNRFTHPRDR